MTTICDSKRTLHIVVLIFSATLVSFFYRGGREYEPLSITIWLLLLAVVLLYRVKDKHNREYSSVELVASLFVLWVAASLFWTENLTTSVVTAPLLVAFLFATYIGSRLEPTWQRDSLNAIIVILLFTASLSLYQFFYLNTPKPTGLMHNPNINASLLNFAILPLCARYLANTVHQRWRERLDLTIIFFLFSTALLIASRGAFLAFIVGISILFIYFFRQGKRRRLMVLTLLLGAAFIPATLLHDRSITAELATTANASTLEQASGRRLLIWRPAITMFAESPVVGHGIGSFWPLYQSLRPTHDASAAQHAHNDYLQLLVELGFIGLALFLTFIGVLFYRIVKTLFLRDETNKNGFIVGLFSAVAAILTHSFFTFNLYVLSPLVITGLYIGILINNLPHRQNANIKGALILMYFTFFALLLYFSTAIFFSERTLKRLYETPTASEAIKLIIKAQEYFPYRDKADILLAKQVVLAINEDRTLLDNDQLIAYALESLDKGLRKFPQRWENPHLRAELMRHSSLPFTDKQVTKGYEESLKLNPSFLPARTSLARFYLENEQPQLALGLLERGWGRFYNIESVYMLDYLKLLKTLSQSHNGALDLSDIERVYQNVKQRHEQQRYLVDAIYFE